MLRGTSSTNGLQGFWIPKPTPQASKHSSLRAGGGRGVGETVDVNLKTVCRVDRLSMNTRVTIAGGVVSTGSRVASTWRIQQAEPEDIHTGKELAELTALTTRYLSLSISTRCLNSQPHRIGIHRDTYLHHWHTSNFHAPGSRPHGTPLEGSHVHRRTTGSSGFFRRRWQGLQRSRCAWVSGDLIYLVIFGTLYSFLTTQSLRTWPRTWV